MIDRTSLPPSLSKPSNYLEIHQNITDMSRAPRLGLAPIARRGCYILCILTDGHVHVDIIQQTPSS